MRAGCCLKEGEGASGKFMLFYEANLVFPRIEKLMSKHTVRRDIDDVQAQSP